MLEMQQMPADADAKCGQPYCVCVKKHLAVAVCATSAETHGKKQKATRETRAHWATLISVSIALGQTLANAARPRTWG